MHHEGRRHSTKPPAGHDGFVHKKRYRLDDRVDPYLFLLTFFTRIFRHGTWKLVDAKSERGWGTRRTGPGADPGAAEVGALVDGASRALLHRRSGLEGMDLDPEPRPAARPGGGAAPQPAAAGGDPATRHPSFWWSSMFEIRNKYKRHFSFSSLSFLVYTAHCLIVSNAVLSNGTGTLTLKTKKPPETLKTSEFQKLTLIQNQKTHPRPLKLTN